MRQDDLVLVIDMQNVYRKGEPWACLHTDRAAENIRKVLDRRPAVRALFTKFVPPVHPEGAWKDYNQAYREINESVYLNELVPVLKKRAADYPVCEKSTYSSLRVPEVRDRAREAGRIILTGVVAECCVLATAFDAIDMGCHVVYLTDGVSGFDAAREEAAVLALKGLSPVHTAIMTTQEYLDEME